MKRNFQFFLKKSKSLTAKRKNCHNVKNMIKFYSNFNYWMKNFDCTSHDTWNMNETSFRVNCEISQLMMTLSQRKVIITDFDNRDYIIFACINETNDSIFTFLILKEVNILSKWAWKNDLNDDVVLFTSDIDYSNDVLTFEWLKYFDTHSKKLHKDLFRMLVMNDYESHLTYKFYEYAKSHDIYLMRLFSHSIHLTQSLNVEMFQSFKYHHSKTIDVSIRLSDANFTKLNFLIAFHHFRIKAFKFENVRSEWKKIEFILFNSEMMLSKIRIRNFDFAFVKRSRYRFIFFFLTSSVLSVFCISSKSNPMIEQSEKIIKQLKSDQLISSKQLRAYIKEFSTNANLLMIVERQLKINQTASIRKRARQKLADTIVQKRDIIIVNDVRHNHIVRTQKKTERMKTRDCRMKAVLQKKFYYMTRS